MAETLTTSALHSLATKHPSSDKPVSHARMEANATSVDQQEKKSKLKATTNSSQAERRIKIYQPGVAARVA